MPRAPMTVEAALLALRTRGKPKNRDGMARFGINVERAFGVPMPDIRACAAGIVRDHALAEALWQTGFHEARILACLVDRPQWVRPDQMDRWTADIDSWDLCDQVCGNLWDRTPFAVDRIRQWAGDEREFVRRAAFATLAWKAVHDKAAPDKLFLELLPLIGDHSKDGRNFVRKAVNWALRQIGKRSAGLHGPCLSLALDLADSEDRTARWIGVDAVRELDSAKVKSKLGL
jgi:3-methyladenine DNA glycosylase AlkD